MPPETPSESPLTQFVRREVIRAFLASMIVGLLGGVIREWLPLHSTAGTCLYAAEITLGWVAACHAVELGILDKTTLGQTAVMILYAAMRTYTIVHHFL